MTEKQYNEYLAHHGILGQKWGKKNGPPYPLGASDHSASEKKAGWKKSLATAGKVAKVAKSVTESHPKTETRQKTKNELEREKYGINPPHPKTSADDLARSVNNKSELKQYSMNKDTAKKILKYGAIAAGTGLAVYGTYKLAQTGQLQTAVNAGKKAMTSMGQTAKLAAKQAGKGFVDGIPNGAYNQGKRFGEVIAGGITLLAVKELADIAAGGDAVDKAITAYNNYNKKNKVGNATTSRRQSDDDED